MTAVDPTGPLLPITALFAGILAVLFVAFALLVVLNRRRAKVSLGDGGDERLGLAIRRFGNFIEYVPIALILMAVVELNGADAWVLWAMGALLVAGRLLHFAGLHPVKAPTVPRVAGIAANWVAILVGGAVAVLQFLGLA